MEIIMFDLDKIENDWKKSSFCLSEDEIIKIYQSEKVTLTEYNKEVEQYKKKTRCILSAEERLLKMIFKEDINEPDNKEKIDPPKRKRLSKDSQKKVIEGSLNIVFDSTRQWHQFFQERISMEKIYYICLESLMSSVKYMMHDEKRTFRLYVLKGIEINIIRYISKWEKIPYQEAYRIINNLNEQGEFLFEQDRLQELSLADKKEEIIEKPSKIFYRLKNEKIDIDYIKKISKDEFLVDYYLALDTMDEDEKNIMQMSYTSNGERGLTYAEISEYLGIDTKTVSNIKKRAIRKLRKSKQLTRYLG